ncbi:MAG: hypothetical protein AAF903_12370 [Pseudomonadota bacterium]
MSASPEQAARVAAVKATRKLDEIIAEDGQQLGRANGRGIREGMCLCHPVKGKKPFWVNGESGSFGCLKGHGCGGDIFDYFEQFRDLSFRDALAELEEDSVPMDAQDLERLEQKRAVEREAREVRRRDQAEKERRQNYEKWRETVPAVPSPVADYLVARGITLTDACKSLRYAPDEPYWYVDGDKPKRVHTGPCMMAAITGADGRFMGLHRTWLDLDNAPSFKADLRGPDGEPLKAKKMRGSKKGGAIWLVNYNPHDPRPALLLAGEGIETTFSAHAAALAAGLGDAWQVLAAAMGDLGNMSGPTLGPSTKHPDGRGFIPSNEPDLREVAFVPPPHVQAGILLGDGDSEPLATRARLTAAQKRWAHHGCATLVAMAAEGLDFNDMWRAHMAGQEAA